MAQHVSAQRRAKSGGKKVDRHVVADERVASLVPTGPQMLVIAGNKPHRTLLHDFILEDYGMDDVLRSVHSERL
jgi:hypothetical protein